MFDANSSLEELKGNIEIKKTDDNLHHIDGKIRINSSQEFNSFSLQNSILRVNSDLGVQTFQYWMDYRYSLLCGNGNETSPKSKVF